MNSPKICIKTNGRKGEIFVNGKKLDGVKGYKFVHSARKNKGLPTLRIDLQASDVTLETTCIPALPELYKPFYERKKNQRISSGASS